LQLEDAVRARIEEFRRGLDEAHGKVQDVVKEILAVKVGEEAQKKEEGNGGE
jgi:hypothetical protein